MNDDNQILWICGISWLRDDNTYFPEAVYPGIVSGSAFQQAIIEGMETKGKKVKILSDCDMTSGNRIEWTHNGSSSDVRVAGNGNKYLRIPKKIIELKKEIKKDKFLEGIKYAIAYEMHFPYLVCLMYIKKIKPDIKTVLICPDLSVYMDLNASTNKVKLFLKKIESIMSKKILKSVDGFVLFTEQMNDYFGEYKKPYTVIEGVYRDKYKLEQLDKKNYFMCAGSLHKNTGIEEMIDAFEALGNDTVELWFFGSGAMDEYIISKSKVNHKIKHMGFVDPSVLFKYEQQALLLINVRNPEEGYTKYSFPSKTYEYLASGTLLLSTDLPGIPKEYKKHMIMIEDNSVEKIKEGMMYALSLSKEDKEKRGVEAQLFIKKEKNKYIQSQKLIELLEEL